MSSPGPVTKLQRSFAYRVSRLFPSEFLRWIDVVSAFIDNTPTNLPNQDSFTGIIVGTNQVNSLTIAQLTPLKAGHLIWVQTVGSYFEWQPFSLATVDNITVLNPTANLANAGRFFRVAGPALFFQQQTTWYVDQTNGNDENAGAVNSPIKSYEEYIRRVAGTNGIITPLVATTISQVGNYTGVPHFVINIDAGLPWILQGVLPAASFTGVVSAKTDLVVGTSLAAATSTWTPATELGRLVHDTTADRWAWIAKDNGASSARVSPWATINLTQGAITTAIGNTAVNNGLQTFVPPSLDGLSLTAVGNYTIAAAGQTPILIQQLKFVGNTERMLTTNQGQRIVFQNCQFTTNNPRFNGGSAILNNCNLQVPTSTIIGNDCPAFYVVNAGLWGLGDGTARSYSVNKFSTLTFQSSTLFQNCPLIVLGGSRLDVRDGAWGDTANPITLTLYCFLNITTSLWGTGNTGVWLLMQNGTRVTYAAGATLGGAGPANDVTFGGHVSATPFNTGTRVFDAAATLSFANLTGATFNTGQCVDPLTGCAFLLVA